MTQVAHFPKREHVIFLHVADLRGESGVPRVIVASTDGSWYYEVVSYKEGVPAYRRRAGFVTAGEAVDAALEEVPL